jgi:hypothetical protein
VPLEGIVMRGKFEEAELVVDTGFPQETKVLTKNRRASRRKSTRSRRLGP